MSSEAIPSSTDLNRLTLEELVAVQPRHLRGKLARGMRGPEGERPGRGRAQSLDFEGLGHYEHGDDIRAIDWRASLRSGETTVRRFAASSHRARMVAVDLKPALYFATDERLMAKTACLTAAWLAWAANVANEPVGLAVAGELIAPKRGRRRLLRLLDNIADAFEAAKTRQPEALDFDAIAGMTGREDEICLISETPDDIGGLVRVGRTLSTVRTLRFFLVEDPVVTHTPSPGRYPVRGADGERQVLYVQGGAGFEDDRIKRLGDAGWRIERARDLLPRSHGS